jgi:hypothetical protein
MTGLFEHSAAIRTPDQRLRVFVSLHDAMQPWAAPGAFFNMTERPVPLEEILPANICARLAEVKRRWDPDGLIRANHELEGVSTTKRT